MKKRNKEKRIRMEEREREKVRIKKNDNCTNIKKSGSTILSFAFF